jgi:hypothetical protein
MKLVAALGILLLLTGCSSWSTKDRALFGASVGCQAIDYYQTTTALASGAATEGNPLYGSHPSSLELVLVKSTVLAGIGYIADEFPQDRTSSLIVALIPCLGVIAWNQAQQ